MKFLLSFIITYPIVFTLLLTMAGLVKTSHVPGTDVSAGFVINPPITINNEVECWDCDDYLMKRLPLYKPSNDTPQLNYLISSSMHITSVNYDEIISIEPCYEKTLPCIYLSKLAL